MHSKVGAASCAVAVCSFSVAVTVSRLLTRSGLMGVWLILLNSSMVRWSYRRSFLHATNKIGSPPQKC